MRIAPFLAVLLLPRALAAQDSDNDAIKKTILERVRKKLQEERARILKQVAQAIDEEFRKESSDPPEQKLRDLERRLRILEDQREEILTEIAKTKRLAEDEPLKREAKERAPKDEEGAQEWFENAVKDHEAKKYEESIRKFKILYYAHPRTTFGVASAYNAACGYALAGKKDHALDWLEVTIGAGYRRFDHLRKDADLDSLRNEKRYKRLMADK